jgi:hypothetical protein
MGKLVAGGWIRGVGQEVKVKLSNTKRGDRDVGSGRKEAAT